MPSDAGFAPCVVRSGTLHSGASRGALPASCCGAGLRVMGLLPPEAGLRAAASPATRLAVAGGVAALAFSAVVRLAYRGRRLREINWVKGGLLAGLVTGLAFPLFLQAMQPSPGRWTHRPCRLRPDYGPLVGVLAAVAAGVLLGSHSEWKRSPRTLRRSARRWLPGTACSTIPYLSRALITTDPARAGLSRDETDNAHSMMRSRVREVQILRVLVDVPQTSGQSDASQEFPVSRARPLSALAALCVVVIAGCSGDDNGGPNPVPTLVAIEVTPC